MQFSKHYCSSYISSNVQKKLYSIYELLLDRYGPQGWWPAETPFEIVVGAILTQSVAWSNVEKAITSLKEAGLIDLHELDRAAVEQIASLIHSTIYYNEKAKKLKNLLHFLKQRYHGELSRLFCLPVPELRAELLSIKGVGEETADSIILYAAGKPSFVIDAYTRRIFFRLGLAHEKEKYTKLRSLFMNNLEQGTSLYNEYHALLVRHGKEHCCPIPVCAGCPLGSLCDFQTDD